MCLEYDRICMYASWVAYRAQFVHPTRRFLHCNRIAQKVSRNSSQADQPGNEYMETFVCARACARVCACARCVRACLRMHVRVRASHSPQIRGFPRRNSRFAIWAIASRFLRGSTDSRITIGETSTPLATDSMRTLATRWPNICSGRFASPDALSPIIDRESVTPPKKSPL